MNETPKEQRHRSNNVTDTVDLDEQEDVNLEVQERLNKLDITPVSGGTSIDISPGYRNSENPNFHAK